MVLSYPYDVGLGRKVPTFETETCPKGAAKPELINDDEHSI
jgi:hypothetical protein